MESRKMLYGNWVTISAIVLGSMCLIMLVILLFAALQIRLSQNTEVLRYFDSSFLARAAEYNRISLLLSIAERFLYWTSLAGILIILAKNIFAAKRLPVWQAAIAFAAFIIVIYIIVLPLQYYRGFVIEHRFGLSNQTVSSWFVDMIKDRAISFAVSTLMLTIIYVLMLYLSRNWWFAAAVIFILFIIIANFIFPVLIDPLFYKFTPLADKTLKDKILAMAEYAQIEVGAIMVADASRKTNTVNAYFSGLGKTKRIVIFDNLLNKNSSEEVLSVIAHEIGHWKYRHILIGIVIESVSILFMFFIFRIAQLKMDISVSIKLVLVFFIFYSLISYVTMPVQNFISRQFEKQADKAAVELTGDPTTAVLIFKNLATTNLSNVDPSPILKYIIYSHPPIIERIRSAEK